MSLHGTRRQWALCPAVIPYCNSTAGIRRDGINRKRSPRMLSQSGFRTAFSSSNRGQSERSFVRSLGRRHSSRLSALRQQSQTEEGSFSADTALAMSHSRFCRRRQAGLAFPASYPVIQGPENAVSPELRTAPTGPTGWRTDRLLNQQTCHMGKAGTIVRLQQVADLRRVIWRRLGYQVLLGRVLNSEPQKSNVRPWTTEHGSGGASPEAGQACGPAGRIMGCVRRSCGISVNSSRKCLCCPLCWPLPEALKS